MTCSKCNRPVNCQLSEADDTDNEDDEEAALLLEIKKQKTRNRIEALTKHLADLEANGEAGTATRRTTRERHAETPVTMDSPAHHSNPYSALTQQLSAHQITSTAYPGTSYNPGLVVNPRTSHKPSLVNPGTSYNPSPRNNPRAYLSANTVHEMSSTSQKHRNFVSEPMGDKKVTELAGIGPVLGGRLQRKGFDKADTVLAQFLALKKNKEYFVDWIKDAAGANAKQSNECYNCLKDWSDANM